MLDNKPTLFIISLHIFVLSSFAFSQPIFDILEKNTGFFVAHNSQFVEILLLTIAVVFVIPFTLSIVICVSSIISNRLQKLMIGVTITALISLILLQISVKLFQNAGIVLIVLSIILAVGITTLYLRVSWLKNYLTILSPTIIIFPLLFLFSSPVSDMFENESIKKNDSIPKLTSTPPIIMVVFDEFPLTSLLDEQRKIDSTLYPNFSLLASEAYWFRNATTVSAFTDTAVPAILTGNYPAHDSIVHPAPTTKNYPNNLFSFLKNTYDIVSFETITMLNENDSIGQELTVDKMRLLFADLSAIYLHILLPTELTESLPPLTGRWLNFWSLSFSEIKHDMPGKYKYKGDRPYTVVRYLNTITATKRPTLYFLHIELPHIRYEYLPSGKWYGPVNFIPHGMGENRWSFDEWEVIQGYQRHLLQVGFVDRILGDIISRLNEVGIYESSLVVVTADHGESFIKGTPARGITDLNYQDILPVPLLIKLPNQKKEYISDKNVEIIDILPSIAGVLGINLPWDLDGQSVFDNTFSRLKKKAIRKDGKHLIYEPIIEKKYDTLERKIKLFGSHDYDAIFSIGSYTGLLGKKASLITTKDKSNLKVQLDNYSIYRNVNTTDVIIPAFIKGTVILDKYLEPPVHIAVGINGVTRAVTKTYIANDGKIKFTAMIPESSFEHGKNKIELFEVSSLNNEVRLNFIVPETLKPTNHDTTSAPDYAWNSKILFDAGGNAKQYQQEGWSKPNGGITWTDGHKATIILNIPKPNSPVILKVKAKAFLVNNVLDKQLVRIVINEHNSGIWEISESGFHQYTLTISPDLFRENGKQIISFEIPTSAIPAELGVSGDLRALGLAFSTLSLDI